MLESISLGVLVGVIWGAIGYAVGKAKNNEAFDEAKFAKTVFIGIILGGFSKFLGVPIETLEGMSVVGFWTAVVDKLANLFFKKKG